MRQDRDNGGKTRDRADKKCESKSEEANNKKC